MGFEKQIGDVVFINDRDLGISEDMKATDRPCIIVDFDGYDYYVIHMTTKSGVNDDPNRNQIRLQCGSYVKLNSSLKKFDHNFIYYSESPDYSSSYKYSFTDEEFDIIYDTYIKR